MENKISDQHSLVFRYRISLLIFLAGLVLSGLTAFPLLREVEWLARLGGVAPGADYRTLTGLAYWLAYVRQGLRDTYTAYPFVAYGTDWLAFAHLVIAIYFIAPLRRPGTYQWTLVAGMISCALVPALALGCGPLRGIPVYWRLIDCSFGVGGVLPLAYCYWLGRKLKT